MKWSAAGALADWVEPSRSTSSCATWLPPPRIIAIAAAAPPLALIAIIPEVVPASIV
jgi:hypothetical protein